MNVTSTIPIHQISQMCTVCVCVDYGEVEKNNIQLKYPEPSSSQNIMEICICLPLLLISCTRINVIWLHCMKYAT